jgi:hypothetical protein
MLAQTIVIVAMLAIFAASAIAGVAGAARARTANVAKALIVPGIETALGRYQRYVAATIASQSMPPSGAAAAPPPEVLALNGATAWVEQRSLEDADSGPLRIAVDIVPTAQSAPACDGDGELGPDTAVAVQCSPFVQESRLSLAISSAVGPADASGAVSPIARSRYTVTLRLFAQAPYAVVTGVKDAADPDGFHEADLAGWGGALGPFGSPGPSADDTTIHVIYQCVPGTGSCANSNPPPPDAPTTLPWTNGNGRIR